MAVQRGSFSRDDRANSIYQYLPVDVPDGAAGLTVELSYDRSAAVLDLGCFTPDGFRGWSGGARERFAIGPVTATPGYLPGRLPGGTWQIAVGLHRVPPAGVDFALTTMVGQVDVPEEPTAPPVAPGSRPAARDLAAPPGMRWLAGDLHAHSLHSDGSLGLEQVAAAGAAAGLDFLAVTDHNTTSHHPHLDRVGAKHGVILLPGQEVTTATGHANAFGDIGWVDFREPAPTWVTEVAARGGLLSINHPLAGGLTWRQPLAVRPPLAEIWHWSWLDTRWGGPISWWQAWGQDTIPVGGSDFHAPEEGRPVGAPTTWVLAAEPSVTGVLDGLRAGRTAITADRSAAALLRVDDELLATGCDGALLIGPDGRGTPVRGDRSRVVAGPGPWRVETHEGAVVALCR